MSVEDILTGIEGGTRCDGGANYIQMIEGMGLLGVIFGTLTGLMVSVIIIGMPIIIAVEVMYINLPFMKDKFDDMIIKTSGKLNDAMEFTIRDAKKAIIQANTLQTGKSVNLIYFGIKIKAVFIATLIIGLVLMVGPALLVYIRKVVKLIISGLSRSL